jgi:MFS family permease
MTSDLGGKPARQRFRKLWLSVGVSNFGDGLRGTVLPLLVLAATQDAGAVATLVALESVAELVSTLVAGPVVDLFDRVRLRVGLDFTRGALVSGFAACVIAAPGQIQVWHFYVFAVVLACVEAMSDLAAIAIVPQIVGRDDLESASSRLMSTELVLGGVVGPLVAPWLFGWAPGSPLALDGATFVVAGAVLVWARIPRRRPVPSPDQEGPRVSLRGLARSLVGGFAWLWASPSMRTLAITSTALGFATIFATATLPAMITLERGASATAYGVVVAAVSVGAMIGAVWAGHLPTSVPRRRVLALAIGSNAVAFLGCWLISNVWVIAALLAASACAGYLWNVCTMALRQSTIPQERMGAVNGAYRAAVLLLQPVGAALGGVVATQWQPSTTYLVGSVVLALSTVGLVVSSHRHTWAGSPPPDEPQ